jgi:type I restriction enzyme S subunit
VELDLEQLPPDWTCATLGSIGEVRYGLGQPPEQTDDGVPMIRATNVKRGRISAEGLIRIKREAIPESRNAFLKAGDIVVVRSGAYTGDVAMITKQWAGSVAGYDLVLSLGEQVDPGFCSFNLLGDRVQTYFRSQSARSAQPHLNRHQLESTEIPLPPLPEQQKIAGVLGCVWQAIGQQESLLLLTTELKTTLLRHLFNQGLRGEPQKETELGQLPQSWGFDTLENLALSIDYGTSVKCELGTVGSPVLRIPNVINGSIDFSELKYGQPKPTEIEQLRLRMGDLLFVRTNGVLENAGRCALYRGELEGSYFASYLIRVRVDSSKVLPAFVNEYARTQRGQSFLSGCAIRTADGKFNINSGTLRRMLIPLPNLDEQAEIVHQIELAEQKSKLHEAKLRTLADLFGTLLQQLMTAQIRVHDLDVPELEAATAE